MAELHFRCVDNEDGTSQFIWNWTGVPSDSQNSYLSRVVRLDTSIELGYFPGAEDNAYGVDYELRVPTDVGIYVQVINEAAGFHFEDDEIVTCTTAAIAPAVATPDVLPFTGISDWLLPLAIALVAIGSLLVRAVSRDS